MPRASGSQRRASPPPPPQRQQASPDPDSDEDEQEYQDGQAEGQTNDATKKQAALLVRTALTVHYAGKTYRRSDMNRIVGGHRFLPPVLNRAQAILRSIYGMELVEMRAKWKASDEQGEAAETQGRQDSTQTQTQVRRGRGRRSDLETLDEEAEEDDEDVEDEGEGEGGAGKATEGKAPGKKKEKTSQIYVLRSVLPLPIQQAIVNPRPLDIERVIEREDSGAVIPWEAADASQTGSIALLGLRTLIQCIILTNGRQISDNDLRAYLRRLDIKDDTPLPFHSRETPNAQPLTLESFLNHLDRSLYLQKVKTSLSTTVTSGRGEAGGEGFGIEWRWGQREPEFSEVAAAAFIQEVMFTGVPDDEGQPQEEEEEEDGRSGERSRRNKKKDKDKSRRKDGDGVETVAQKKKRVLKDVESAAGSTLMGEI